ncbi:MAG: type I methionyl aminopeptidase [Aquiluna sp.]|nr:type I methionyl aminopeptidase [Aquiluna sp.]MCF8545150.1 type I methionyl aminopeptidase [Aquiluna sp.]
MPKGLDRSLIPGKISKPLPVPSHIIRPEYVGKPGPSPHVGGDRYDAETIARIRKASKIAAQALAVVLDSAKPGMTTNDLDIIGHEFLISQGAYPSTLGYRGFPKSLCSSLNEVICHGIPDETMLEDGDLVNIDISAYINGVHGDTNGTVVIGDASQEIFDLVDRTREATHRGIRAALPGREVNIVGRAIETYAKRFNYGVVRDFTGHGVGTSFHTGLIIPHYDEPLYTDLIEVGMVFTVEPMITLGTADWDMWEDGWTVTTKDKKYTAQFEHTILITEDGPEILTEA